MIQKLRGKFVCQSVEKIGDIEEISLSAVVDGSEENKSFSKWTPSATVKMSISNPDAQGFFTEGKEYYGDFSEAVNEAPAAENTESAPPAAE